MILRCEFYAVKKKNDIFPYCTVRLCFQYEFEISLKDFIFLFGYFGNLFNFRFIL